MELLGPRAKKRVAKFNAFASAFVDSWPAWAARQQRDFSSTHPTHYLVTTIGRPPPKPETPRRRMPQELLDLCQLQSKNGQWKPSAAVYHCLGDAIPDPRGGIVDWRWTTALCCAFIRRYPEFWPEMEECYGKALHWVPDQSLLELASSCLPPPLDYALDPRAVAAGEWKTAVTDLTASQGYVAFDPDPSATAEAVNRTERRFQRRATEAVSVATSMSGGGGGDDTSEDEDDEHARAALGDLPKWKQEMVLQQQAEEKVKRREQRQRRREAKETADLRRTLKHEIDTATGVVKDLLAEQRSGLTVEWAAAENTGERPIVPGECVSVYARRPDRWSPLSPKKTGFPAKITRVNLDTTLDIVYLDGACEREYRVERKLICRQGERGYEPGVGGWGIMRTRAEALRQRWQHNPGLRDETVQLADVKQAAITKTPFVVLPPCAVDVLPLRAGNLLEPRARSRRSRRVNPEESNTPQRAGEEIMERTLSELHAINQRKPTDLSRSATAPTVRPLGLSLVTEGYLNAATPFQRRGVGGVEAAEADVITSIFAYEAMLKQVKAAAVAGSRKWAEAFAIEVKQVAFTDLTHRLRDLRGLGISLCDAVVRWQAAKLGPQGFTSPINRRKSSALPTPTASGGPSRPSVQFPSDFAPLGSPKKRGTIAAPPEPPPFIWNGSNVLVKMCTCLDYLGTIRELREWYSEAYPFDGNPLAMHQRLDDRPTTPVPTTRKVFIGGEEVEQEVASLVQLNAEQQGKLDAWVLALNDSPAWWPVRDLVGFDGYAEDPVVAEKLKLMTSCRRVMKHLLAERNRDQEHAGKLSALDTTLARATKPK